MRWRDASDTVGRLLWEAVAPAAPVVKKPPARGVIAAKRTKFLLERSGMTEHLLSKSWASLQAQDVAFVLLTVPSRCRLSAGRARAPSWRGLRAPRYGNGWGTCPASRGSGSRVPRARSDAIASRPCGIARPPAARPGCGSCSGALPGG